MPVRLSLIVATLVACSFPISADEILYRFEGDISPCDPSAGWTCGRPCEDPCSDSVEDGHYVLRYATGGGLSNYDLSIVPTSQPVPFSTFWVEWRFRSNHPLGPNFYSCDANLRYNFDRIHSSLNMYGDAAISASGDDAIFPLAIDDFHTYRFESPDGVNYTIAVDGLVFEEDSNLTSPGGAFLQMGGRGGCDGFQNTVNEWDFIRLGTLASAEKIKGSDPPAGVLDPALFPDLDRFTVTFDAANYVYIDDIVVSVTSGLAPAVIQTRRRESDEPDTVEIVLDRFMQAGQTTTFTFDTGVPADCDADPPVNCIRYTLTCGDGSSNHPDEECDDGPDNSDTVPDACRANCKLAACGDGVTDSGEACDDGSSNSDTLPDACRTDCTPAACGDNVTDTAEECDGTDDDACPGECEADCSCHVPGIPTVSHWGLLAMAVLLLLFSNRYFGRIGVR